MTILTIQMDDPHLSSLTGCDRIKHQPIVLP